MPDLVAEVDLLDLQRLAWDARKRFAMLAVIVLGAGTIAVPYFIWGLISNDAAFMVGVVFLGLSLLVALPIACVMAFMQTRRIRRLKKLYLEGGLSSLPTIPLAVGNRLGGGFEVTEVSSSSLVIERQGGLGRLMAENIAGAVMGLALVIAGIVMIASNGPVMRQSNGDVHGRGTALMYILMGVGAACVGGSMVPRTHTLRATSNPASLILEQVAWTAVPRAITLDRSELSHLEIDVFNTVRARTDADKKVHLFSCGVSNIRGYGGARGQRTNTEAETFQAISRWRARRAAATLGRVWAKSRPIDLRVLQA